MPANKYALLRYRIIDRSIRNPHRPFPSKEDLRTACEEALYGSDGEHISMSTIDKDLWAMRNEGQLGFYAPISFNKQEKGYFYEDPEYTIAELPLNDDDLDAIRTAAETLFQFRDIPLFTHFNSAIEKILDRMKIDAVDVDKVSQNLIQFEKASEYVGGEFLKRIYEAAKQRVVVNFQYQKFNSADSRNVILEPYLLKEYKGRWYVIGRDQDRDSIRTYSLDRMKGLDLTSELFPENKRFNVDRFFEHAMGITVTEEEPVEIRLRFKSVLAPYILSQPIHATQKVIQSNEAGIEISLHVLNTPELTTTILGFGEQVEVLSPNEIRDQVKHALRESLSTYSD